MENFKPYLNSCTVALHPCRCFDKLTEDQMKVITEHSVVIRFRKREMICKQGGIASSIMYMEKGLARISLDQGGNTLVLKVIPEGNFIGLGSVAEGQGTYHYSAMAYVDCEVRQIEVSAFRSLLLENPAFAKEMIDILSSNNAQIYGRFFCLTHKQAYGRLADILLCLSDRIFKNTQFELPLNRRDLADLSGMSPETVIRMLKKFHDDGLILITRKNLKILDYQRLLRISETG
ncbi:MAG: Crp/Fnr family transcriptional regulator [Bacteroidales bacterium]